MKAELKQEVKHELARELDAAMTAELRGLRSDLKSAGIGRRPRTGGSEGGSGTESEVTDDSNPKARPRVNLTINSS